MNSFKIIVSTIGPRKYHFISILWCYTRVLTIVSCAHNVLATQLMSWCCNRSDSHPETAVFTLRKEITLIVLYSFILCHTYIYNVYLSVDTARVFIRRVGWHGTRKRSGRLSDQLIVVESTSKQAYYTCYIIVINNERIFVQ